MNVLLALGLLFAPIQQLDLSVGPKILADEPYIYVTPGYHLHHRAFKLSLQAPARLNLADSRLRTSDIDSLSDYGRVIRYLEYSDSIKIGALSNYSDEHHLVLDHYFNQIDDDRHRTALRLHTTFDEVRTTLFVDQVLGAPIMGMIMGAMPMERVRLSVVAAGDTARPESMETDATAPYGAAALTASYAMVTTHRIGMDVYATAAQTHSFGTGGHLGLETLLKHLWGWRVRLRMEGMLFTDGYNWAPFDLLYLIRRQRIIASNEGADQQGFGGRLLLKMEQKSVELGIETSGAIGSPQQTNTLWVALPKKPFHIFAVFHAGRHTDLRHPFNNRNISAAISAQLNLSERWMVESSITHVQRDNGSGYRGFLEAGIFTNWRTTFQ